MYATHLSQGPQTVFALMDSHWDSVLRSLGNKANMFMLHHSCNRRKAPLIGQKHHEGCHHGLSTKTTAIVTV